MDTATRLRSRLRAAATLVPASIVAVLACWSLSGPAGHRSTQSVDQTSDTSVVVGRVPTAQDVLLRTPGGVVVVTLDDTQAARAFAAMLPLRLSLDDAMGQAKSGKLPSSIGVTGSVRVYDPTVGELYYWPPSHTIALFYDDLGQSVPPPGLVRLGVADSGLSAISTSRSGFGFPVRIESGTITAARIGS